MSSLNEDVLSINRQDRVLAAVIQETLIAMSFGGPMVLQWSASVWQAFNNVY